MRKSHTNTSYTHMFAPFGVENAQNRDFMLKSPFSGIFWIKLAVTSRYYLNLKLQNPPRVRRKSIQTLLSHICLRNSAQKTLKITIPCQNRSFRQIAVIWWYFASSCDGAHKKCHNFFSRRSYTSSLKYAFLGLYTLRFEAIGEPLEPNQWRKTISKTAPQPHSK